MLFILYTVAVQMALIDSEVDLYDLKDFDVNNKIVFLVI